MSIKKIIKKIGNKMGYDIDIRSKSEFQHGWHPSNLKQIGNPATIIDIGVGRGTYNLYRVFPNAELILFEPLIEFKPIIDKILKDYNGRVFYQAVGSKKGIMEMQVDPRKPTRSSFQGRSADTRSKKSAMQKRKIDVTTLNEFYKKNKEIKKPVLLKIDTEGYEMEVIKGADKFLKHVDIVIAETSVAKRFENSYKFEDFIQLMKKNGFSVFDFLQVTYFSERPGVRYVDIVFKKVKRSGLIIT